MTGVTINRVYNRYNDVVDGHDPFIVHTNGESRRRFLSGMHSPFVTDDPEQWDLLKKSFSEYEFLFGRSSEETMATHSLRTPVVLRSVERLPRDKAIDYSMDTLCVGGAPALISAVKLSEEKKEKLMYLNDDRRIPISYGSAWHLEEDAQTEAPTNYRPSRFLWEQLKRLFHGDYSLKRMNETGEFPWRTIDWMGWICHPEHWFRAMKLSLQYELFTMFGERKELLKDVAKQCSINEEFFDELNEKVNGELLLADRGSIIVARNVQEKEDLLELKRNLREEQRDITLLSAEELKERLGFVPHGIVHGEKKHDQVLRSNFLDILRDYLRRQGSTVLNGTLREILVDEQTNRSLAIFRNSSGEEKRMECSRLILSLGNQPIVNEKNERYFDVIAARGVSILAFVNLPRTFDLPSALVCGGTNHVTKLNAQPIPFDEHRHVYLVRLTAGACITPNVSDESTASYDSSIAVGLLQAVRKTLGKDVFVKPLFIYGCNRQVSRFGQIQWIEPMKNIFVQFGAAGGGLTRAPDFITQLEKK